MTISINEKFYNQIYNPARHLIEILASHPFAMEPVSNTIIHQFEGLTLHVNHFSEKNGLDLTIEDKFRHLANSIKHICRKPEERIDIESALVYEFSKNGFRFIRNTVLAQYVISGTQFDAIEALHGMIRQYFVVLGLNINNFDLLESKYSFFEWAFAYLRDDFAVSTSKSRIVILKKDLSGYIKSDSPLAKFVILDKNVIGLDPKEHFPILDN